MQNVQSLGGIIVVLRIELGIKVVPIFFSEAADDGETVAKTVETSSLEQG